MGTVPTARMVNSAGDEVICNADESSRAVWASRGYRPVDYVAAGGADPVPDVPAEIDIPDETEDKEAAALDDAPVSDDE